jgi:hypothetical protein
MLLSQSNLRPASHCLLVNADMFQWDKELRAIRMVIPARIRTSASVIYP